MLNPSVNEEHTNKSAFFNNGYGLSINPVNSTQSFSSLSSINF